MTLAIRLCVCIRSQYDAVHMPGKPSVMSDSGNILVTMTNTQEPQNTNTSGALAAAKAAGGSKSQLRDAFAEYNPQLQPMADQVFSGFAARCSTYAATLER